MAGSNTINTPSNTMYQRSMISKLASLTALQGSSLTDMQRSLITLTRSAITLQRSANTLQMSANTLTKQSVTDLIISGNDLLRNSVTDLQASANTLLISIRDQSYTPKGNYYNHFNNIRSVYSTIQFGYTSWGQILAVSAGALGGVTFSWDGTNVHGSVYAGEQLAFDRNKRTSISVKCASTANPALRIITWG